MSTFDPRLTPARADLAARHLQGKVTAERYVDGAVYEVIEDRAPVRHAPAPDAALDTEALYGERVTVYETTDEGRCWGQLEADGYVGWLPQNALTTPGPRPTHKVAALRTLIFPGPSIKLPPIGWLPFGARVPVTRMQDMFAVTSRGGFLPVQHLIALDVLERDFVAVAERFVGTPYLWGGKTTFGIDCSGLVQVALNACGIACPRDSDIQQSALGAPLFCRDDTPNLRRGDLVFWKGHVAIVRDATTLLHANAHHMAVTAEPLDAALARIAATGHEVAAVKRLPATAAQSAGAY